MPKPSAEPTPRPAADHDLRLGERDAGGDLVDVLGHLDGQVGLAERGRECLDRRRAGALGRRHGVGSDRQQRQRRVDARLLEQAAAPAHARDGERLAADVDRDAVRGERADPAARPRAPAPRCPWSCPLPPRRWAKAARSARPQPWPRRPARRRRCPRRHERAPRGHAAEPAPIDDGFDVAEPARRASSAWRDSSSSAASTSTQHRHQATPSSRMTSTTAGAASGPWPRISACLPWPAGTTSRSRSSRGSGRGGATRLDRLLPRAQLRGHRRVARQVDALEHRDHRGQRQAVDVAPAGHLLLAARRCRPRPTGPSARWPPAGRARAPRGCRPGSCPSRPTRCRTRSGRSRPRARTASTIAEAVACGSHSSPSVASRMPRSAPIASVSRICSSASGGPSVEHGRPRRRAARPAAPPPPRRTPRAG